MLCLTEGVSTASYTGRSADSIRAKVSRASLAAGLLFGFPTCCIHVICKVYARTDDGSRIFRHLSHSACNPIRALRVENHGAAQDFVSTFGPHLLEKKSLVFCSANSSTAVCFLADARYRGHHCTAYNPGWPCTVQRQGREEHKITGASSGADKWNRGFVGPQERVCHSRLQAGPGSWAVHVQGMPSRYAQIVLWWDSAGCLWSD